MNGTAATCYSGKNGTEILCHCSDGDCCNMMENLCHSHLQPCCGQSGRDKSASITQLFHLCQLGIYEFTKQFPKVCRQCALFSNMKIPLEIKTQNANGNPSILTNLTSMLSSTRHDKRYLRKRQLKNKINECYSFECPDCDFNDEKGKPIEKCVQIQKNVLKIGCCKLKMDLKGEEHH